MNRAKRHAGQRPTDHGGELLLEVGTEEIPSRVLPQALVELKDKASLLLSEARIPAGHVETFATPRRLMIRATGIPQQQEMRILEVTGPPHSTAYDAEGKPTAAARGFAEAQGVPVESLTIKRMEKGDYVCAVRKQPTVRAGHILKNLLPNLITSLEFPRMMRWNGQGLKFARPIRWIMAVFEGVRVPFHLAGLSSGYRSRGHRFTANRSFVVKNWDGYLKGLKRRHVLLEPSERERVIREGLTRLARQRKGREDTDIMEPELLRQAVFLTEDPVVLLGRFDRRYLSLPHEVLTTAMKEHQGYFPLVGKRGGLLPYFLFVSNLKTKNPDMIRAGNERVLRARLEDAQFYFERDKKQTLEERVGLLSSLVFHEKLGSMYHKRERIGRLAKVLLSEKGVSHQAVRRVERAALICKSDLLTGMVREFPSLEGMMGREYARIEGEDPEVAEAIAEHYFPRHAEDQHPPRTTTGKFLAVADRLDTLVGFWGVGLSPSGSMDPYGLRRQGMGLVQILLDGAFEGISLMRVIETAAELYSLNGIQLSKDVPIIREELGRFLTQRMATYLKRRFGQAGEYRADLADTVLCRSVDNPLDLYRRYVALMIFHHQLEFEPLIVVFKRASRILPAGFEGELHPKEFKEGVEKALYQSYLTVEKQVDRSLSQRRYLEVLQALVQLRQPIDAFFNGVMVMDENRPIRENRLALLKGIAKLFYRFGDFTRVAVKE